jgi:ubiquinone/menaquinone biosynthesis C-methylase UbiE
MINNEVHKHFSQLAEEGVWASLYRSDQPMDSETWSFVIRARRVAELLDASGTNLREIVDVGCGTAPVARSVAAMGAHYTGMDFSAEMIESARATIKDLVDQGHADLRVGDATSLPLAEQACDGVLAMGVVEYLAREKIGTVAREMARVLRPNGIAIVTIPKRHHWGVVVDGVLAPLRWLVRGSSKKLKLSLTEEFQRLYLTPGELDEEFRRAGLKKVTARHYNVQPICRPVTAMAPRLTYLINRPFEALALVPLGSFLATGYIGMYRRP